MALLNNKDGQTPKSRVITAHTPIAIRVMIEGITTETAVSPFGSDRKSTCLNSSHSQQSRMPSSA